MRGAAYPLTLLGAGLILLGLSAIHPYEMGTWWMEVFPIVIAVPILAATYRRFPLTPLVYTLIFVHAGILMLGGHYTYARVPLGFWMQDLFDFSRNHYDRIGHLAQGFIPAIIAREILLRRPALTCGRRTSATSRRCWRTSPAPTRSSSASSTTIRTPTGWSWPSSRD